MSKIYPSSLSFSHQEFNPAESESQCWRYAQLSRGAPRVDIHEGYKLIGELHEQMHAADLSGTSQLWEIPFKRAVSETSVLSGRVDFELEASIDETKATYNKQTFAEAKLGKPQGKHLAQLVTYLIEYKFTRGRLIYGYFEHTKEGELIRADTTVLTVELQNGEVLVNGKPTGYTTANLINSILQLDKWLATEALAPRPVSLGYNNACRYCPLAPMCDRVDAELTTVSECMEEAHQLIGAKKQSIPRINRRRK